MNEVRNELKSLFTQYWTYMTVHVACKLNLFDIIKSGGHNVVKITNTMSGNKNAIENLLTALVNLEFLRLIDNRFYLTEKSELLTESHPRTMKNACLLWGIEHLDAWQNLDYTILTGEPSFGNIYSGDTYFEYLKGNPDKLLNYHKAMNEYAIDDYKDLCDRIDFSRYKTIMDVGGSLGALITIVKENNKTASCFLFDKKEVVNLTAIDSVEKIGGDFFQEIPNVAECLILSRIIHDWDDENAKNILAKAYISLPSGGTIIIIENFADRIKGGAALLTLNMMAMCKSYERTEKEYSKLLEEAGFEVDQIQQLNDLQYIIKAIKK